MFHFETNALIENDFLDIGKHMGFLKLRKAKLSDSDEAEFLEEADSYVKQHSKSNSELPFLQ